MRVPRLYVNAPLTLHRPVPLDDAQVHRLTRVLRLRENATVHVFNGNGREYAGTLMRNERRWRILPTGSSEPDGPPPVRITLAQSISRSERMDFALQKAVELGVTGIQPILAERSPARGSPSRLHKRQAHWLRTVIQACEQCGRNELPELLEPRPIAAWMADNTSAVMLHPLAGCSLGELPLAGAHVSLLVGPEGGFSDAELQRARDLGLGCAHLGPRTLRTETTALVALTIVQMRLGDLRSHRTGAWERT